MDVVQNTAPRSRRFVLTGQPEFVVQSGTFQVEIERNDLLPKPGQILCAIRNDQTTPNTAKGAFCALRRGLDASDTEAFPENIYGEALKSNTQRYIDIANAFSEYGANQGDPEKATGGGMDNRKRQDYNDVGWKILIENYSRHITQIDPEETSIAWWQVDTTIYGRFARGFDATNGKDSMFFDLDDRFFGNQSLSGKKEISIEVTYLDSDAGSWKLLYDADGDSLKTAMEITNSGESEWKTKRLINPAFSGESPHP